MIKADGERHQLDACNTKKKGEAEELSAGRITRQLGGGIQRRGAIGHKGAADVFGEAVEGDAVGTGDVLLGGVVRPGREDQEATGGNGIKEES